MSTEYKDSWSLIMDLERKNILSEKKMMEFIEILRTNGLTFLIKSGDSVNNLSIRAINRKSKVKQHACKALLMVVVLLILGVITIHVFANKYPDHKLREDETIRNMLTAQQKQAYQKKIRTPPMLDVESNYDLSQMFTELEMYTTTKKENFKDKTKHTFQELLSFIKSREPCKVLITGNGGIGKTTLLQYISYNWATNNDTTFDGKILFLVNVRDIEVEPQSFTDVITDVNEGGKTFIEEHGREIVLLIDGLDELRFGINSKVLTIGEMEYSTVILTSRPGFIEYLYNHYDVHVKLEGFTAKNKKQYINKYFNYVGNFELGKSLITELKLDSTDTSICSGDHKNICEIISSPMLLLTTCIIWKNEKIIPKDFKRLFNEIVRNILNQFINRPDERKENAIPHGNLPTKYKNAILILGQLSYIRLQKNLLHFTKDDVCKLVLNETLVDLALSLGFVYKDSSMVQDSFMEIYRYQYKLLSEALAGFYLSNKIETFNSEECKKIRTNDYLHMVRKYTISFLGSNADKSMKCLETE
ncbi:uncharacterized protein [Antedon mediterranea]|uniref:uncharacterized protein n=1 Tax=Antedon mediterranea TaxID=105859 RepID=UPI003AF7AD7F